MNSEMIWDILEFPNFEYYSAGSMAQPYEPGPAILKRLQPAGYYSKFGNLRISQIISESILENFVHWCFELPCPKEKE